MIQDRTSASCLRSRPSARSRVVFGIVDGLGLVDQHDRDVVLDAVAPLQPRVVQRALVGEVQQRALVFGTGEDLQQLRVQRHGEGLLFRSQLIAPHEREHFCGVSFARCDVGRFEVQPQQRFGVARPEVEPPVAAVDGQSVEAVLFVVRVRARDLLDDRRAGRRPAS